MSCAKVKGVLLCKELRPITSPISHSIRQLKQMSKREKVFSLIAVGIFLFLVGYSIWRKNSVDKDGVYVVAKIKSISDTENGLIYKFTYNFNGKSFNSGYKGFIKSKDSLIILKVSRTKPKLWEYVEAEVPQCLLSPDFLNRSWEGFPRCN